MYVYVCVFAYICCLCGYSVCTYVCVCMHVCMCQANFGVCPVKLNHIYYTISMGKSLFIKEKVMSEKISTLIISTECTCEYACVDAYMYLYTCCVMHV